MKGFSIVLGPPCLIVDLLVSALLVLFLFDLSAILGVHPETQILSEQWVHPQQKASACRPVGL